MNRRTRVLGTALLAGLACSAFSQGKVDLSLPDLMNLKQDKGALAKAPAEVRSVPMDAPLDPAEYYVGPGDGLSLNVWSSSPADYQLTVTPEAILLIPSVGAVSVRDLTLEQARKKVIPLAQKKFPNSEITLTLTSPRKVSVKISGQVMNEGILDMSSVQRVSHFIEAANVLPSTQLTRDFYYTDVPWLRRNASQRNISLHRQDGTIRKVDLVKFAVTGKSQFNPYLREGDIVYVPLRLVGDNNVGVLGAFLGPENVEFADGDSLTDLVLIGNGLKPEADPEHAFLARASANGGMDTVAVDLKAIMEGRAPNIAVRPGDRLFVPEHPSKAEGDYVVVEGEVASPGRYPISPNRTYVRDIIRLAGGFTPYANRSACTITRGRAFISDLPAEIRLEEMRSMRTTWLVPEDSLYYFTDTALRLRGEAVSVDFHKLFVGGDTTCDVTLRHFDKIVVPRLTGSVYVFGQVLQPGHIKYASGEGYRYYIDKANGYTDDARPGDVRVIKAGSKLWLSPGETEVEDGDMIWVPKDYHYPFAYFLTATAQIAAIIGTVATIIILATTIR